MHLFQLRYMQPAAFGLVFGLDLCLDFVLTLSQSPLCFLTFNYQIRGRALRRLSAADCTARLMLSGTVLVLTVVSGCMRDSFRPFEKKSHA